ncbi:MAG TPA: class I SAM-dependent methyltransferase [Casimicrobiaceae bacterium]|jgi:demethylmenaquinone methyltransferase/2-methoxy-6-polyprenyl-1,4-benzoquinol methylase
MSIVAPSTDAPLIAEQIAYYRARAGEYDEWWFRAGRYDRGVDRNAAWFADVEIVETSLFAFLDAVGPQEVLELACGTGLFTRHLAPRVRHVTAVDASPEVIACNRARVNHQNVNYVLADLFEWTPSKRYDLVFMSFWLSHVPLARFDPFWSVVRQALTSRGDAYVIDSALDPTSTARDHPPLDAESGIVTRKLNDGSQYRIVKLFHDTAALNRRLAALGFESAIDRTPHYFIHGKVSQKTTAVPSQKD